MNPLLIALRVGLLTLVATGLAYPLAVTGVAQLLFPSEANGSQVRDGSGQVVGSALLAQPFALPGYFHPRPSAAGVRGWDAASSAGSNLGPTSRALTVQAAARRDGLFREDPGASVGGVPAELVTASASGLDPHLSPQAALWQLPRVAAARHLDPERVRAVVEDQRQGRDCGLLGEPRVDVLLLNLALDRQFGPPPGAPR